MSTLYYGGSGTDPLVRIDIVQVDASFNVTVTQVQATDADASHDPDGKFYLGDLRGFFIDFAGTENGVQLSNYKIYQNYDATGLGTAVSLTNKNSVVKTTDTVTGIGGSDNNMSGAGDGGYNVGLE